MIQQKRINNKRYISTFRYIEIEREITLVHWHKLLSLIDTQGNSLDGQTPTHLMDTTTLYTLHFCKDTCIFWQRLAAYATHTGENPWVLFVVAGKSVKQRTLNVLVHSFTDSKISFTNESSLFFLLSVQFRLYRLLGSSFKLWLNFSFTKRSLEKYLMHTKFRRERER